MSHKCTRCGEIFVDGAAVILSGCPSCGWNKFLYVKGPEEEEESVSEETSLEVLDETHQQKTPAEKLITEIDEIMGIEKTERSVVEEDGDRVESVRI